LAEELGYGDVIGLLLQVVLWWTLEIVLYSLLLVREEPRDRDIVWLLLQLVVVMLLLEGFQVQLIEIFGHCDIIFRLLQVLQKYRVDT
jgi:hypothetical protein